MSSDQKKKCPHTTSFDSPGAKLGDLVGGHEPSHDILEALHEDLAMDRWEGRPGVRGGKSPPSRWAFTLPQVDMLIPTKKPRGQELGVEQKAAKQALARRRVRIEHVNSSVKRCRIVKDTLRLLKAGVRDLVMEICCAFHNFRVRLTPWQPMI